MSTNSVGESPQSIVTVEIESGAVVDVRGLPDGYQYEVLDHDVESEPIRESLYLATVNVLVKATSPGHAAGIIIFALSDYDRDDDALIDWDYAVQDGERQFPKCVSLDLGPENITELLDHIATQGE